MTILNKYLNFIKQKFDFSNKQYNNNYRYYVSNYNGANMKKLIFLICIFFTMLHASKYCYSLEYKGKINNRYPIEMLLQFENNDIVGLYYYTKYKNDISLRGTLVGDSLIISEYTRRSKYSKELVVSGRFSGKIEPDSSISGNWINTQKNKEYSFFLKKQKSHVYSNETNKNRIKIGFPKKNAVFYLRVSHVWKQFFQNRLIDDMGNGWNCYISNCTSPYTTIERMIFSQPLEKYDHGHCKIEYIGKLNSKHVYSVLYGGFNQKNSSKIIIMQNAEGSFSIVYKIDLIRGYYSNHMEKIHQVGNVDVLEIIVCWSGTGAMTTQLYLYEKDGVLYDYKFLNQAREIAYTLIPDGYNIWKGGGFHINGLYFYHSARIYEIGKPISVGTIEITFKLIGDSLVVDNYIWKEGGDIDYDKLFAE